MKGILTLSILLFSLFASAQNLTGVWRGYFDFPSSSGMGKDRYKYEVQIDNKPNNALGGVTYSYLSTIFYGKASTQGIFMKKDKSLILKENKLVEVKMAGSSSPCLMTCYLDYVKIEGVEVLQGTYTSIKTDNNADCGSGIVYLEKVTESDFEKEDFVVKYEEKKKLKPLVTPKPVKKTAVVASKPKPKTPVITAKAKPKVPAGATTKAKPPVAAKPKPSPSPSVVKSLPVKPKPEVVKPVVPAMPEAPKPPVVTGSNRIPEPREMPIPPVLLERENALVRTLTTNSRDIKIELYDNGQIDNDTVSVYYNNSVIVNRKKLSHDPITLTINADENEPNHEFVMVAENLGEIPPNTALMVITTGGKRYELYLVSTEEKNAKVVIQYKP